MADEFYTSAGVRYTIEVYPGPADGKKHPMILVVHGNSASPRRSVSRFTASPRNSPIRVM
jgi:hypothetical protein